MGKSIRSKRLKRLRTLKRELVAPHYDAKELAKLAAQEAAAQAPKIELPTTRRRSESEAMAVDEAQTRGRSGQSVTSAINGADLASGSVVVTGRLLQAKGGIKKRGKSQGRLKKERHHKKKLQF
ncbi:unnamed protein product [Sphagnum jensenii]|uniref:Uncharacterized protein n=1 Tax=Sphagnum jensenii TaxID=128206 RepID=A0ABP0WQI0_9BRYO